MSVSVAATVAVPRHPSRHEVVADCIIHILGIAGGSIGGATLVALIAMRGDWLELGALLIYACGMIAMFCCSAAYNLARTLDAIAQCTPGTDIVVFPEAQITGFLNSQNIAERAEPLHGPSVRAIQAAARERDLAVVVGLIENDGGRYYNTTVLITAPAGMSERWDLGGKRSEYDDGIQAAAGGSGIKTWTFSAARAAAAWLSASGIMKTMPWTVKAI